MKLREGETLEEAIRRQPLERLMRVRVEPLLDASAGSASPILEMVVSHVERALIGAALERCGGRLGDAAAILGIHRNTLRNKLRALGFEAGPRRRAGRGMAQD